jgi:hypothetical protein
VFLNLQIQTSQKTNSSLSYKLFHKPNSSYQYPHFFFYIPKFIKTDLIITKILHIARRCSTLENASKEFANFIYLLLLRGYNCNFVLNTVKKYQITRISLTNTVCPKSLLLASYAAKISKRRNNKIVNYHIVMDHCQSLNYNQINQHIKELETKKVRISIRQLSNILVKLQKISCAQYMQKNQSLVQLLIDLSNFKK